MLQLSFIFLFNVQRDVLQWLWLLLVICNHLKSIISVLLKKKSWNVLFNSPRQLLQEAFNWVCYRYGLWYRLDTDVEHQWLQTYFTISGVKSTGDWMLSIVTKSIAWSSYKKLWTSLCILNFFFLSLFTTKFLLIVIRQSLWIAHYICSKYLQLLHNLLLKNNLKAVISFAAKQFQMRPPQISSNASLILFLSSNLNRRLSVGGANYGKTLFYRLDMAQKVTDL